MSVQRLRNIRKELDLLGQEKEASTEAILKILEKTDPNIWQFESPRRGVHRFRVGNNGNGLELRWKA